MFTHFSVLFLLTGNLHRKKTNTAAHIVTEPRKSSLSFPYHFITVFKFVSPQNPPHSSPKTVSVYVSHQRPFWTAPTVSTHIQRAAWRPPANQPVEFVWKTKQSSGVIHLCCPSAWWAEGGGMVTEWLKIVVVTGHLWRCHFNHCQFAQEIHMVNCVNQFYAELHMWYYIKWGCWILDFDQKVLIYFILIFYSFYKNTFLCTHMSTLTD